MSGIIGVQVARDDRMVNVPIPGTLTDSSSQGWGMALWLPGYTVPWSHAIFLWLATSISVSVHEVNPFPETNMYICAVLCHLCSSSRHQPFNQRLSRMHMAWLLLSLINPAEIAHASKTGVHPCCKLSQVRGGCSASLGRPGPISKHVRLPQGLFEQQCS